MKTGFKARVGVVAMMVAGCAADPGSDETERDPPGDGTALEVTRNPVTVNIEDGAIDALPLAVRQDLTYCIHSSFGDTNPALPGLIAETLEEAALDWESAADLDFRHVPEQDGPGCTNQNQNVHFNVTFGPTRGGVATAFMPYEPRSSRVLTVSAEAIARHVFGTRRLGPLFKHEMGHMIGFRHEHEWSDNEDCANDRIETDLSLTPIDTASVMWYPNTCGSTAAGDYALSNFDRLGAACLYNRNVSMGTCSQERSGTDVMWWTAGNGQATRLIPSNSLAIAVSGDFDGDRADDILFYGRGAAADTVWWGQVSGFSSTTTAVTVDGLYDPIVGDFNGDGRSDIFWYGPGRRPDVIWWGRANRTFQTQGAVVNGVYHPLAGDFDGNGCDDILWHRPEGTDALWSFHPDGSHDNDVSVMDGYFRPVVGDLDGDGRSDIVSYEPEVNNGAIWYGRAARNQFDKVNRLLPNGNFFPFTGDFNRDGRSDIFWYQPGDGADAIWDGQANRTFAGRAKDVDGYYSPVAGDFDGDTDDDVYWYAPL